MPDSRVSTSSPNLRANGERQDQFLSPRIIMREAAKVCDDLHLDIRGAQLRTLVNSFITHGGTDADFRSWVISYADPTGEHASARLDRSGWPLKAQRLARRRGEAVND